MSLGKFLSASSILIWKQLRLLLRKGDKFLRMQEEILNAPIWVSAIVMQFCHIYIFQYQIQPEPDGAQEWME